MRNPRVLAVDRSEDLIDQLNQVARGMRPQPEILVCERIAAFDDLIQDGDFDVVVAGPSLANRSGLGRLALLHTQMPELSIILAFSDRPHANLREIVRTGAVDLLHLPVNDDFLQETLERAIAMSRSAPAVEERTAVTRTKGEGMVVAIASPSGGSGKTTFAINLAYHLQRAQASACIVDLDLEFGRVASALRLRPRYTIVDLAQREEGDEDALEGLLDELIVEHDTGISVLAAPKDPSEADAVGGADVIRILQVLRAKFDFVVVDSPASLNEVVLSALDLADSIYVLSPVDLPNLRNVLRFLTTLKQLKISDDAVRLVLNKEERDTGIDLSEVNKLFPQGFSMVLPYSREVSKSLNLGVPLLAYRPATEYSRRLIATLNEAFPVATVGDSPTEDSSPLRWLRGRKR